MKKIALVLSVILSVAFLAGCASKAKEQPAPAPEQTEAPAAHKDLKGERL